MSKKLKRTSLFAKDINSLLYAYGDVAQPLSETVNCLDELVSSYLTDICHNANKVSKHTISKSKIKIDDFRFVLRNDPIKLGRADELIATNKLITEAKKQFNETDTTIARSDQYYSGVKKDNSNLSNDSNGNSNLGSNRELNNGIVDATEYDEGELEEEEEEFENEEDEEEEEEEFDNEEED